MKRPDYKKYVLGIRGLFPKAYVAKQNDYIDHLEQENKSLREALKAIAEVTKKWEGDMPKLINQIAIKALKI